MRKPRARTARLRRSRAGKGRLPRSSRHRASSKLRCKISATHSASLRGNPGFAVVIILTLALSIGANSAIFSVIHGVLLKSLPYAQPERIVTYFPVQSRAIPKFPLNPYDFLRLPRAQPVLRFHGRLHPRRPAALRGWRTRALVRIPRNRRLFPCARPASPAGSRIRFSAPRFPATDCR